MVVRDGGEGSERRGLVGRSSPLIGMQPYLMKHVSLWFPASTAMSVAVTHSRPPSATHCTALSRKVLGDPYEVRRLVSGRTVVEGKQWLRANRERKTVEGKQREEGMVLT